METVANWKSLKSNLIRQVGASLGHVMMYSRPKSRGYRAGKNGEVRIPPPVPFEPFVGVPDVISVPFKCSLFPAGRKSGASIPECFVRSTTFGLRAEAGKRETKLFILPPSSRPRTTAPTGIGPYIGKLAHSIRDSTKRIRGYAKYDSARFNRDAARRRLFQEKAIVFALV